MQSRLSHPKPWSATIAGIGGCVGKPSVRLPPIVNVRITASRFPLPEPGKSASMDEAVQTRVTPAALGLANLRSKVAEPGFVGRHAVDGSPDIAAQADQRLS